MTTLRFGRETRLKPQRPHTHRFRPGPPEGPIVRMRCECGCFRVAWDGPAERRQRPLISPAREARLRGIAAWAAESPVAPATAAWAAEPPVAPATRWKAVEAALRAAGGEAVRAADIETAAWGSPRNDGGALLGATISYLRKKYGADAIRTEKGKGYAWNRTP